MLNENKELYALSVTELLGEAIGEQLQSPPLLKPDPERKRGSETIMVDFADKLRYTRKFRKRKPRGRSKRRNYARKSRMIENEALKRSLSRKEREAMEGISKREEYRELREGETY